MYALQITVDTNDGDYVTKVTDVSEDELNLIKKFIELLNKENIRFGSKKSSRMTLEQEEVIEKFESQYYYIFEPIEYYFPRCEYGFHSIESIKYTPIDKWIELL